MRPLPLCFAAVWPVVVGTPVRRGDLPPPNRQRRLARRSRSHWRLGGLLGQLHGRLSQQWLRGWGGFLEAHSWPVKEVRLLRLGAAEPRLDEQDQRSLAQLPSGLLKHRHHLHVSTDWTAYPWWHLALYMVPRVHDIMFAHDLEELSVTAHLMVHPLQVTLLRLGEPAPLQEILLRIGQILLRLGSGRCFAFCTAQLTLLRPLRKERDSHGDFLPTRQRQLLPLRQAQWHPNDGVELCRR